MNCSIRPSKHAKDQMIERGISKEEVITAILKGSKFKQQNKIVAHYAYISVVFIPCPCNYFIITVMVGQ